MSSVSGCTTHTTCSGCQKIIGPRDTIISDISGVFHRQCFQVPVQPSLAGYHDVVPLLADSSVEDVMKKNVSDAEEGKLDEIVGRLDEGETSVEDIQKSIIYAKKQNISISPLEFCLNKHQLLGLLKGGITIEALHFAARFDLLNVMLEQSTPSIDLIQRAIHSSESGSMSQQALKLFGLKTIVVKTPQKISADDIYFLALHHREYLQAGTPVYVRAAVENNCPDVIQALAEIFPKRSQVLSDPLFNQAMTLATNYPPIRAILREWNGLEISKIVAESRTDAVELRQSAPIALPVFNELPKVVPFTDESFGDVSFESIRSLSHLTKLIDAVSVDMARTLSVRYNDQIYKCQANTARFEEKKQEALQIVGSLHKELLKTIRPEEASLVLYFTMQKGPIIALRHLFLGLEESLKGRYIAKMDRYTPAEPIIISTTPDAITVTGTYNITIHDCQVESCPEVMPYTGKFVYNLTAGTLTTNVLELDPLESR
ncbi:MAG: hypothetical protein HW387_1203 [Parachlamydiales bacterium]|nr:hypothetical protein [Parachlamydiales bacterium]